MSAGSNDVRDNTSNCCHSQISFYSTSKPCKHLHRPTDRSHQLRETSAKPILSSQVSTHVVPAHTELPSIVTLGGDDLPCSRSADTKSCTPCASLPSEDSVSCARRAVDHTYVLMTDRNKRRLNSVGGQQKPAYMRVALADTFPEFFRLARLLHRAVVDRGCKRVDEIRRRLRENVFQRLLLLTRLRRSLRGWRWALQQVGDVDRRVLRFVVHGRRMKETQSHPSRRVCESHDWSCISKLFTTRKPGQSTLVPPHRGAGSPLAVTPISVTSVSGSSFPLNSGKNDASVYGQCTDGDPL
jgi:hypothetical protein